jgi:hypothetical protein
MSNQNINTASSLYQYLLSLVNQTNVEIENSSEQSIEVLKFRLEWLEQQLSNIRETYGKNNLKSLIMDYYLSGMIQTEISEEGPSEGDIECIIELLIEDEKLPDEFDSLLNQALSIFNIK